MGGGSHPSSPALEVCTQSVRPEKKPREDGRGEGRVSCCVGTRLCTRGSRSRASLGLCRPLQRPSVAASAWLRVGVRAARACRGLTSVCLSPQVVSDSCPGRGSRVLTEGTLQAGSADPKVYPSECGLCVLSPVSVCHSTGSTVKNDELSAFSQPLQRKLLC